jgi:hypothetical protein
MSSPAAAPAPDRQAQADQLAWHVLTAERVLQQEEVDGRQGLSSGEARPALRGQLPARRSPSGAAAADGQG